MANVKITQLPSATTPLTGTEVFPLVQGTTTKQVAITGLFTSPVMTNPTLGTVGQADLINATGLPISTGVAGLGTGIATFLGTPSSSNLRAAVTDETGTGSLVFATSPVLVTPNLGTPSVLVATNATGTAVGLTAGSAITNANLTGAVTSVGNATSLGSFTSAQLRTALTDETGAGSAVFATSPTITAPILNQINDTNNAQILGLSPTTSAVDYLVVKNGIGVGVPLHFYADGSSANIGLHIQPKGTGLVTISDGTDFNKGIRFRSSSSAASAITLLDAVSTAGRVVTLPDATTTLVGRDTTDTLTNKTIAFSSNTFSGTLAIANGGTNASTAALAIENLLPAYAGNGSKGLRLNSGATALEWVADGGGTVTSVAASVPSFLSIAGSPITTSGTLAISLSGTALPTTSGGTGLTSFTSGGVVYASSSSALATGSALTFNGTSLGIGSSSYGDAGSITASIGVAGTTSGGLQLFASSAQEHFIQWGDATSGSGTYAGAIGYSHASDYMRFYVASAEAMRLTSTSLYTASGINVGFGTSSPNLLTWNRAVTTNTASGNVAYELAIGGSAQAYFAADASNIYLAGYANKPLLIRTNNTTALTIDTSGNLGLGVTPSAWTSNRLAYQNSSSAFWTVPSVPDLCFLSANFFDDGANKYIANGYASYYRQGSGAHSWHTAPNNTSGAGAPATLTQAMTLDASGNLGVGTTSPNYRLSIAGTANNANSEIIITATSVASGYLGSNANGLNIGTDTAGLVFKTGVAGSVGATGTERMRISNAGLVGIGVSSPTSLLTIGSGSYTAAASQTTGMYTNITTGLYVLSDGFTVATRTGGDRLILDTSGNLGLGVTPSAWASVYKAMQLNTYGAITSDTSAKVNISSNGYAYAQDAWAYLANNNATLYQQASGQHRWFNAPSGFGAGQAISFIQAMTLDASGALLINATSNDNAANRLYIQGYQGYASSATDLATSATKASARIRGSNDSSMSTFMGALTNGSAQYLQVANFSGTSSYDFAINPYGGNLLVGTTSVVNLSKFCLVGDFYNGNGQAIQTTNDGSGAQFLSFLNSAGTVIGSVNRVSTTNAVVYNTTSDYRLKTVTGSVTGQGARIDALKPVDYLWTDGGQQARGFLAHEFQTVYPNSVTGEKDAVDADGNPKYQAMQAATSEVIADLVAEIQSLRQRLSAANL